MPNAFISFNTEVDATEYPLYEWELVQEIKSLITVTKCEKGIEDNGLNKLQESRRKEPLGLLEKGVFEPVHKAEARNYRVFSCKFFDTIKN